MATVKQARPRSVKAACFLGLFATALILLGLLESFLGLLESFLGLFESFLGLFTNWRYGGGFHWLLIAPAVLLINLIGGFLAAMAVARRSNLKWAVTGVAMNCIPSICVLGIVLSAYFAMPPARLYTLPSGKQILITSVLRMHFSSGPPALVMNCETDIAIDDMPTLRKEADEIWNIFSNDVEGAGMTMGVIRMTHNDPGDGWIKHGKGYGFVFEKRADGKWHCLDDEKK
jgi:hypothetical protein